jgi:hypothetical protein
MMDHRTTGVRRRPTSSLRGRWLILVISLGLVLIGCGGGFTCKGCVETARPGYLNYRYQSFNGSITKQVNADAGVILTVNYQATVETGTLAMRVLNPEGEAVWEQTFDVGEDVANSVQVDMGRQGRYKLIVEGHQTRGAFEVDWQVN